MMVLKCDRCKTVMEDPVTDSTVKTRNTLTGKRFDLCKPCIEATSTFIRSGLLDNEHEAPWYVPSDDDPSVTVKVQPQRTPTSMTMPRPAECFEGEDIYRWLLAEANWLVGGIHKAQHQIRILEDWSDRGLLGSPFEHDSVQRDCDEGNPPPSQG